MIAAAALVMVAVAVPGAPVPALSPRLQVPRVADTTPGARLRVFLLTFDTGAAIWERFGHNAIWIHDPERGTDHAYDYGRFSFQERGFLLRFIQGRLFYWMGDGPVSAYLAQYRQAGRRIWRQELNLPPAARLELQRFLQWNLREENRFYRYDYYLDNCSTRIRDALDRAAGGAIHQYAASRPAALTYREHTRRLTQHNPLFNAGLLTALGRPVDRPITAWDEMFLPIELRPHLNSVRVPGPDGTERPLVLEERLLFDSDRFPVPDRPSSWLGWFLLAGALGGSVLAVTGRLRRRSPAAGRGYVVLGIGWSVVAGIAGLVMAGLWGLTDHQFSVANENVLQLNLLSLAVAATLPGAAASSEGARRPAGEWLALAVLAVSGIGLAAKLLPGFVQANLAVIALVLPIHTGLWVGLRAGHPPRSRRSPSRASE